MGVCSICVAWAALWLRSPYGCVLNMFGMGRPMAPVSQELSTSVPMGVCSICLAWAAPWLRCPYGRVLNMFGMCRPMAPVSLWARAQYVWHGLPYGCALPMGVCLICLAWAALWPRCPYGRVLNMFGMGRPMAALSLGACA